MSGEKDEHSICLATSAEDVKLWGTRGFLLNQQFNPHSGNGNVSSISWSHDNNVLASTSTSAQDKIFLTYINANSHSVAVDGSAGVQCASFSSDARYIAGGNISGLVNVWDINTGRVRKVFDVPRHKGPVTAVDFGFRDATIATGSNVGEVILYNCTTGQGFSPLQTPSKQTIRQVQFSQFRKSLLGAACDDGALYLWDTNSKVLLRRFDADAGAHQAPCTGLVFSPCNQMLLVSVGLDKSITCYDVVCNKVIRNIACDEPLTSVDLLDDGSTLAVGSSRGRVHVYDIRVMSVPFQTMSAHRSAVNRVSFQRNSGVLKKARTGTAASDFVTRGAKLNNNYSKTASESSLQKQLTVSRQNPLTKAYNGASALSEDLPAVSQSSDQQVSVSNLDDVFSPIRDGGCLISSTDVSAEKSQTSWSGRASENNVASSADCISGELFSPLAGAPSSREKVSSSDLTSGVFSPSLYCTAMNFTSVPRPMLIDEDQRKDVLQEVFVDAKLMLGLDENKLLQRSLNGVMSASESDLTEDRRASRVCFESSQRSLKSSSMSASLNSAAIRQLSPSSPAGNRHRLSPPKKIDAAHVSVPASQRPRNSACVSADGLCPAAAADVQQPQQPAQPETDSRLDSLVKAEHCVDSAGDSQNVTLHPYLVELVRNTVRDEVEECEERLHRSLLHLHADMLRQFHVQQLQIQAMLKEYSINEDLLSEIERLKAENARLKINY